MPHSCQKIMTKKSHQKYPKRERERAIGTFDLRHFVTVRKKHPPASRTCQKLEAKPGEKLWTFPRLSLLHFVHPWAFDLRLLAKKKKKEKNHQTRWCSHRCEEDSPTLACSEHKDFAPLSSPKKSGAHDSPKLFSLIPTRAWGWNKESDSRHCVCWPETAKCQSMII